MAEKSRSTTTPMVPAGLRTARQTARRQGLWTVGFAMLLTSGGGTDPAATPSYPFPALNRIRGSRKAYMISLSRLISRNTNTNHSSAACTTV